LDGWSLGYLAILYQLQLLFRNEIYDRMLFFTEIERIVEEKDVTCFKIFPDTRLEGLRKIVKHLKTARVPYLCSYLELP
jgi:hypothetical protein